MTTPTLELRHGSLSNPIDNESFEIVGTGGADVFANWNEETTGTGVITQATGGKVGTYCCQLATGSAGTAKVWQGVTGIDVGVPYRLQVWTKVSSGAPAASWGVYDVANSNWIVPLTTSMGIATTDWTLFTGYFTIPAGCTGIQIHLCSSEAENASFYFDYAILLGPLVDLMGQALCGLGWQLENWLPQAAPAQSTVLPPPIEEALDLSVSGSSITDLGRYLAMMSYMGRNADFYLREPYTLAPVWLHTQLDGEAVVRRALIRELRPTFASSWFRAPIMDSAVLESAAIVREPWWEMETAQTMGENTPSAGASVSYDYTNANSIVHDVDGDVPARIAYMTMRGSQDGFARVWCGIRSAKGGRNISVFHKIWEVENGTPSTDVTETSDSSASGGYKDRVTPSSLPWTDLTLVCTVKLSEVTTFEDGQFGAYLWLLRAKVDIGTWEVQVRWGYQGMSPDLYETSRIIQISSTSWNIFEVDQWDIPGRNLRALPLEYEADAMEAQFTLKVYARRTSGSGSLDVDCLMPIPVDEGYLIASGFGTVVTYQDHLTIAESPMGEYEVVNIGQVTLVGIRHKAEYEINNFRLPPGEGKMIIVYARESSHVLTDTIVINEDDAGKYFERWSGLYGV